MNIVQKEELEGYLLEQEVHADALFAKEAYVHWRGCGKCREMYPDFREYREQFILGRWWLFVKAN